MKTIILSALLAVSASAAASELHIDNNVRVLSHNGTNVESYKERIPLSAGQQVLFVQYEEIFDYSAEDHAVIRSPIHIIRFDAIQGAPYRISVDDSQLYDVEQARAFASSPDFVLVDSNNSAVDHMSLSRDEALVKILSNY